MTAGRPPIYETVEEMNTKIDEYFNICDKLGKPYTVLGMCLHLDIDRDTLLKYQQKDKFVGTIKKAKARIESYAENLLFEGKNPAGIIFNLKNNFGWKDKQEVDVTMANITIEPPKFEE